MYSPGNRQRPGFMHPSSIGRVQNNTPVTNFITAPFEDQMATPRNDARRVALLLNQPLNIGDRIFFCQPRGNSPGKERAIRQQMKKIADHLA